ncbi:hypothetical protein [Paenibacillus sp. JJ-223]|uniref:hypothetical protein n=1 Tax=Paenibacillus sp. JJ-223 TaxID=2905647 RepID=UPI001F457D72|nr:hypothetical protein [Paenibacillus sp. JJ-223]CAH1203126.1 hypothetical protein PAECIP111890_02148 [Paenibacillus sp. JJ-223]
MNKEDRIVYFNELITILCSDLKIESKIRYLSELIKNTNIDHFIMSEFKGDTLVLTGSQSIYYDELIVCFKGVSYINCSRFIPTEFIRMPTKEEYLSCLNEEIIESEENCIVFDVKQLNKQYRNNYIIIFDDFNFEIKKSWYLSYDKLIERWQESIKNRNRDSK